MGRKRSLNRLGGALALALVLVTTPLVPFLATQAAAVAGGCAVASFSGPTNFGVGTGPWSVALGDFNGDGAVDLAVANRDSNNVSILLGDGTGGFAPATPPDHAVETAPHTVAVGDFNADGRADLAVTNSGAPGKDVSILLGTGTGNFGPATSFGQGPGQLDARDLALGDFNGDGNLDLAVVNHFFNTVAILLGDGAGSFGARTDFGGVGLFPIFVAVADFNGDGRQDLVVGNAGSNTISILLGTGTGSFGGATNFFVGSGAIGVAVGDFNGDGKVDVAVANAGSNDVSILLGDGMGGFGVATNFPAGTAPGELVVADFNGDGKLDLAVSNNGSNDVSILLGDGTGGFGAATNFPAGTLPRLLAVGDFNGDGRPDLAIPNTGSNDVTILLNTCNQPPDAVCKNLSVPTDPGRCVTSSVSVNNGSSDPDGDQITLVQSPGGPYALGTTSATLTATDPSAASDSCTATVTVADLENPTIVCPAPVTAECTGSNSATVTPGSATAGDNCAVATVVEPGTVSFPLGSTPVAYTATDSSGNSQSCSTTITVVDTTKPTVSCVQSVNPGGNNIPGAHTTNEDGFYRVSAADLCSTPTIKLGGFTLANGETIKLTQTPGRAGVRLVNTMGPLRIRHFHVGPQDAVIIATDGSGNSQAATCLVPPPPK